MINRAAILFRYINNTGLIATGKHDENKVSYHITQSSSISLHCCHSKYYSYKPICGLLFSCYQLFSESDYPNLIDHRIHRRLQVLQ